MAQLLPSRFHDPDPMQCLVGKRVAAQTSISRARQNSLDVDLFHFRFLGPEIVTSRTCRLRQYAACLKELVTVWLMRQYSTVFSQKNGIFSMLFQ